MYVNRVAAYFQQEDPSPYDIDQLYEGAQALVAVGLDFRSMKRVPGTPRSEEVLLFALWLVARGELSLQAVKRFHTNELLLTKVASLPLAHQERMSTAGATVEVYRGQHPNGESIVDNVAVVDLTDRELNQVFTYDGPLIGDLMGCV
jgi:hypothetical protein